MTYLSIPSDALAHAERFGARQDSGTGVWFVVGPIPSELKNYIPRPKNQRFQEVAPPCPMCGAPTRKAISRSGQPYWSCVARFKIGCPGTVDYLDYLDDMAPVSSVGDHLPHFVGSLFGPTDSSALPIEKTPHPLKARWVAIVQEASQVLGGDREAVLWLLQRKLAFSNRAPIELLGTEAGCGEVVALLRDVWR